MTTSPPEAPPVSERDCLVIVSSKSRRRGTWKRCENVVCAHLHATRVRTCGGREHRDRHRREARACRSARLSGHFLSGTPRPPGSRTSSSDSSALEGCETSNTWQEIQCHTSTPYTFIVFNKNKAPRISLKVTTFLRLRETAHIMRLTNPHPSSAAQPQDSAREG